MDHFIKLSLALVLGTALSVADTLQDKTAQTYTLLSKNGMKTSYLLADDEFAASHRKSTVSKPEGVDKELLQTPSYTLFSLKGKTASLQTSDNGSEEIKKSGLVFYKEGKRDDSHRYISTGMVIITFSKDHVPNIKTFEKTYHLKYVKTLGDPRLRTMLFKNNSNKNDIELSSALTKQAYIDTAKPNWILPVKLF